MLRNRDAPYCPTSSTLLNEVLSLNAQESIPRSLSTSRRRILNEVLSLNAQESPIIMFTSAFLGILNEVLSLNAQE